MEVSPEVAAYLNQRVAAGDFATADQGLHEAVELLRRRQVLRDKLARADQQLAEGLSMVLDDDGLDELFGRLKGEVLGSEGGG